MDVLGHKLRSSFQDIRNVVDEENDYVSKCNSEIFLSPDPKHEIVQLYNLVIAEEGHSPPKIFEHLNKRIGKPNFSSEDFFKFSRNKYFIKVSKI